MGSGEPEEDESDTEVMEECVYISDTDEHENDNDNDDNDDDGMGETEGVELDHDHAISQLQQPCHMQKRPGQYHDLANSSV